VTEDPYEELSYKVDALLTKEYGKEKIDFKYVDVSSPDILEYINHVTNIVEGRLPLPYVALNDKPLCWGLSEAKDVIGRIKQKLQES
jgi:disulfide oxidoreductase YuzD